MKQYNREFTPFIEKGTLQSPKHIFVFGSNEQGIHGAGSALTAYRYYGAVYHDGFGLQGQSYAIPTKRTPYVSLNLLKIRAYINTFIETAKQMHYADNEYKFYVTAIGCGYAGFTPNEIAPLFIDALDLEFIILPKEFVEVITQTIEQCESGCEKVKIYSAKIIEWVKVVGHDYSQELKNDEKCVKKSKYRCWSDAPINPFTVCNECPFYDKFTFEEYLRQQK